MPQIKIIFLDFIQSNYITAKKKQPWSGYPSSGPTGIVLEIKFASAHTYTQ